jgi:hypothetical protein
MFERQSDYKKMLDEINIMNYKLFTSLSTLNQLVYRGCQLLQ